jgi:hypothetical protein
MPSAAARHALLARLGGRAGDELASRNEAD